MTKITDGKKTACIGVAYYMNGKSTGDFSAKFLGLDKVPPMNGKYVVEDVDACIADAKAWAEYTGEYACEFGNDPKVNAFGMERVAHVVEH